MSDPKHFVICINNGEYAGTLELRKVYEVLEDASAELRNYTRIIDESGEDYLYPKSWFVPVAVPQNIEELLHDLVMK
ncbi:MAG TPA: hypothetical protein VHY33_09380 [Thermoanaerobaculia bacterium]|jgi:hypothetical protein|nr:hypothetical protein [Thermoanaerobaculia bacterium]